VSPHSWGFPHEVNEFVERSSQELARRGHRVLIAAPSESRTAIREGRSAIRAFESNRASLFSKNGEPRVLCVGQALPLPRGGGRRSTTVPIDVSRSLETLLGNGDIDIVHVHEPFAPSTSSVALRHSHSLNVGSFHEPSERLLSTQVARPLVEIFFGRLDARTASSHVTAEVLERYFPGGYELVPPGADVEPRREEKGPLRILYCAEEEKGALRLFLRALRRLPLELEWEATVWSYEPDDPLIRIGRRLRDRVRLVGPADGRPEDFIATADVVCATSGGPKPAPGAIRKALAGGAVAVASQLDVYAELIGEGDRGLLFPPGDPITLAGQLERLAKSPTLRTELRKKARAAGAARSWADVAVDLEQIYTGITARRHDPAGKAEIRRRLAKKPTIDVDLHMHTDHSPDCATPVNVLLETALDRGLGAIAITDHNEISGALEAREIAEQMDGLKVIVAEEVKTADQGEVIGLFLREKIPRGMTMAETIAAIRKQGGIVYMPHPFDRFHSVPDYEHLLDVVEDIDILEIFNPRIAVTAFNEEAVRFAAKYRIVPGAGSDSHVAQGLGSVRIRLHDFDGPEEFLEAMRDADIVHKHKNLVYVQALKFLQTTGRPKAAKRKIANAKPVKGGQRRTRRRNGSTRRSGKT
jgi:predicted metal-dependent phosphoesterase TrpH/glycosyltransferase involved in cell wall biosynthesis